MRRRLGWGKGGNATRAASPHRKLKGGMRRALGRHTGQLPRTFYPPPRHPNHEETRHFFPDQRRCDHLVMKDTLKPGISLEARHTVTPEMAPVHLPVKVLSTPSMIQLIEGTCLQAAQAHLDEGETTVGTHVCVSHSGPAAGGEAGRGSCSLDQRVRRGTTLRLWVRSVRG